MAKDLVQEIKKTYGALLHTLSLFSDHQIDVVPFEGSWTAGQVAEHLLKGGFSTGDFFRQNVKPSERPPDAAVEGIKNFFLDFTTKSQSMEFLRPVQTVHDKRTLLQQLEKQQNDYVDAAQHLDLSYLCLGMKLPGADYLTRMEWIYLNVYHTQRHIRQLQNIYKTLQPTTSKA